MYSYSDILKAQTLKPWQPYAQKIALFGSIVLEFVLTFDVLDIDSLGKSFDILVAMDLNVNCW